MGYFISSTLFWASCWIFQTNLKHKCLWSWRTSQWHPASAGCARPIWKEFPLEDTSPPNPFPTLLPRLVFPCGAPSLLLVCGWRGSRATLGVEMAGWSSSPGWLKNWQTLFGCVAGLPPWLLVLPRLQIFFGRVEIKGENGGLTETLLLWVGRDPRL